MLEEFTISESSSLQDAALSALPLFTIGQVRRAILSGAVTISGRRASPDAPVAPGDVLTVDLDAAGIPKIEPLAPDFAVLFEDDSLLVLDKPAGVATVPERGADNWPLMGMLLYHAAGCPLCRPAPRFRIVHRLDRDTSGVVAVAKTPAAERALSAMFAGREVDKRYLAIVSGEPASDEGTIDAPSPLPPVPKAPWRSAPAANPPQPPGASSSASAASLFSKPAPSPAAPTKSASTSPTPARPSPSTPSTPAPTPFP